MPELHFLTVHWRTAGNVYIWKADFTQIYDLKNHIKIPVVCNWDIMNYDEWISKLNSPWLIN